MASISPRNRDMRSNNPVLKAVNSRSCCISHSLPVSPRSTATNRWKRSCHSLASASAVDGNPKYLSAPRVSGRHSSIVLRCKRLTVALFEVNRCADLIALAVSHAHICGFGQLHFPGAEARQKTLPSELQQRLRRACGDACQISFPRKDQRKPEALSSSIASIDACDPSIAWRGSLPWRLWVLGDAFLY